jgi:predicted PurR-regulated permease PerM
MTTYPPPAARRRRSRAERRITFALKLVALVILAALVLWAVLGFFGRIPSVVVILVGAIFFAYVVAPAVRVLSKRMPLIWAITTVYAGLAVLLAILVATVAPALYEDSQSLVRSTPGFVHAAQTALEDPTNPLLARLPVPVRSYLATVPPQLVKIAESYAGEAASRALGLLASAAGLVATVVVIPILSIYLMLEAPGLVAALMRALPEKAQPRARALVADLDGVLGGFIRGQLLVGATIGTCITIALLVLHVKYAVLIGVVAGLFDVIPFVGAFVGFVPAVLLALVNDGWQHALIVALVFVALFQAEGHFIAPKIVSESVGLSPLMVIVAILVGGELLGIPGMFVAVPIAAALRIVLLHALPNARPLPDAGEATAPADPAAPSARPERPKKAERSGASERTA